MEDQSLEGTHTERHLGAEGGFLFLAKKKNGKKGEKAKTRERTCLLGGKGGKFEVNQGETRNGGNQGERDIKLTKRDAHNVLEWLGEVTLLQRAHEISGDRVWGVPGIGGTIIKLVVTQGCDNTQGSKEGRRLKRGREVQKVDETKS